VQGSIERRARRFAPILLRSRLSAKPSARSIVGLATSLMAFLKGGRAVQRYGSVDTLAAHMSQMEELQEQIDAALEAMRLVAELRRAAIRNARLRGPAADT
jgi:GAF domain-containing protein